MKVFIIAGVGDHTNYIKRRTAEWKNKYEIEPIALKFGWKGNYQQNYTTIKQIITKLSAGKTIGLIGISAGGSAAIKLATELENVSSVVTICARTSRGGFKLLSLNSFPGYWNSVDALGGLRLKKKILVIKPRYDEVVSVDHMDYENAEVVNTNYLLHIPAVLNILRNEHKVIADFIKR